jgi:hypothetical protein
VHRSQPYGSDDWVKRAAVTLGLESTLRPRGRPKKEQLQTKCACPLPLGDRRAEVDWEKWGSGTNVVIQSFAPGVDDKKLTLSSNQNRS